jgi:aminoglycoside 2'-N-acetyltransferase I
MGASVVRSAGEEIAQRYPITALSTSEHGFYERLGWERWQGPTHVVSGDGWVRTEEEDDGVMVLRVPGCPVADLTLPIAVDERSGDDW